MLWQPDGVPVSFGRFRRYASHATVIQLTCIASNQGNQPLTTERTIAKGYLVCLAFWWLACDQLGFLKRFTRVATRPRPARWSK